MKLKDFVRKSHIEPTLIRAVVRQIGGFEEFKERAPDVVNHGAYAIELVKISLIRLSRGPYESAGNYRQ